jgi:hydroxymethylbilane synthase
MMIDCPKKPLRLGTRASPLAMAQAHMVRAQLLAVHSWAEDLIEICPVVASGDKILDRALAEVGGKALWTKELDQWLISGEIDFSVHSMKDVETHRPTEFTIAAMLERADVRDRLIGAQSIAALPQGARVGTSAPRRHAQLLAIRPDLVICLFRGNVQTRLAKLAAGEAQATLLAAAGLERLSMDDVGVAIAVEEMLPAPSQGAIGIETLVSNYDVTRWISAINHAPTFTCVNAERGLLAGLSGDCRSPVAGLAVIKDTHIWLRCEIYSGDGQYKETGEIMFSTNDDEAPARLAAKLLERAHPAVRASFGA